jgi:hypothetical protein
MSIRAIVPVLAWSIACVSVGTPQAKKEIPPGLEQVIVVFKTHLDIGYTDLAENVVRRYRTEMIDHALSIIDQSRSLPPEQQFQWMMAGWPLRQMLWPGQTLERRARIEGAIATGHLKWHALPFTTETESMDPEDLVRGLGFASGLSRELKLELPRDAKMTDVPEHTWLVPTVLKNAGVEILHIGCNGGSKAPAVPQLFWWEGPDGSRLLTFYSREYGTGLIPPLGWPHKTWLAMIMTGDNQGPPKPEDVTKLLDEARRDMPGVRIRFGRLSDFRDAILKETPKLPVVRADMPDTWIHGLLSMPIETKLVLNTRPQLAALGILDTQMQAWDLRTEPIAQTLAEGYEQSLLYSEHTWGSNSSFVGHRYGAEWKQALAEGRYTKFERSFDEHRSYAHHLAALVRAALQSRMATLATAVRVKGPRAVVFNPLPWTRDAVVEVRIPEGKWEAVRNVATGRVTAVEQQGDVIRFLAAQLPPAGYSTYVPMRRPPVPVADKADLVLENEFLRLVLDLPRGGISSLVDKRGGRELVDQGSDRALGQYIHERFDLPIVQNYHKIYNRFQGSWAWNDFGKPNLPGPESLTYSAQSPRSWKHTVRHTPLADFAELRSDDAAPMASTTTLRIVLYRGLPYVELEWGTERKTPDPIPEGGWLALPFAVNRPTFRLGRAGSIIDPARDIIAGSNRHILCLNPGMTVTGPDGHGIGIGLPDTPLVSLEKPGLWQYSDDFVPKRATIFLNLYNNMWSTNFPLWIGGSWTIRVRLWTVSGAKDEAALITPSVEARTACPAVWADGEAGNQPASQAGISLSRKGILVTAFSPNPDGAGTVLRLWESAGTAGDCVVQLPRGLNPTTVQRVDLRGRDLGEPIPVKNGSFAVRLPAFTPASFVVGTR